jgi:hypothetical protein
MNDYDRRDQYNLEAAKSYGLAGESLKLLRSMVELSETSQKDRSVFAMQAVWLAIRMPVSLDGTLSVLQNACGLCHQDVQLASLLAAAPMALIATKGASHPERHELIKRATPPLVSCAQRMGVDNAEAFADWLQATRFNDSEYVLFSLTALLEDRIGNRWVFDPAVRILTNADSTSR